MELMLLKEIEKEVVESLYNLVKGTKYCVWDEYPGKFEIDNDYENNSLYVLKDNNKIIGAISINKENEMDDLDCWKIRNNTCEIARVVIHPDYQNKKLSIFMVNELINILKSKKISSIHLAAEINNLPAIKLYQRCNFEYVGDTFMYGHNYYLYEKVL